MCPPYPGSPPLARGTDEFADQRRKHTRITPACAGNRQSARWCTLRRKDHPRLRGEQTLRAWRCFSRRGSPPLARGTAIYTALPPATRRITPACAGNRFRLRQGVWVCRDHPRLRGEQCRCRHTRPRAPGSPPLARGTVIALMPCAIRTRITPACAGNRDYPFPLRAGEGDHPRLRGEQVADVAFKVS